MNTISLPAIWLIVLIVGLPQLSETVYTPSLPDIAISLKTSEALVEYTLTIYLFGFAIGTLFWGKLSDIFGRKLCIIAGLQIFIIGCIGCYLSNSIEILLLSRFIQAFGGSIGSVLGQAVCRDAFHGPALGKVYSTIGSALALFPAIGPLCGGLIAEWFGWTNIFIFLIIFALILIALIIVKLPETHLNIGRNQISIFRIANSLITDKNVIGFGLIVSGCNGILFSYFAEGSFYLINGLNLSRSMYGGSFIGIAFATMIGGVLSRKLHAYRSSKEIMTYGLYIISFGTIAFSSVALVNHALYLLPTYAMALLTLVCQMVISLGLCMATSNALALALKDYKHAIGVASSLFGFFYYCLISIFTFFMGLLHNGTLLPMPFYFLGLSCFMIIVNRVCLID
jgi:MFS transporter, DHA1 family, multidrug resistance protein